MSETGPWKVREPYRQRPIHFLELRRHHGWRLKIYSIVYGSAPLDVEAYEDGLRMSLTSLPRPAVTESRPGVGFVIWHQGRDMHYLVLSWWDNENEFFNRVFVRPIARPAGRQSVWRPASSGESACVWDLQVIWFEREAYVATVLGRAGGPDIEAYLARHLTIAADAPG